MKNLIIIVSILILPLIVLANKEEENKKSDRIAIIVNDCLKIGDSLDIYIQDLKNEGYEPLLKEWSLIKQPDPRELKEYLKSLYNSPESLQGAVFVGNLPVALFQEFEELRKNAGPQKEEEQAINVEPYPTDRYFMDCDEWEDIDDDGIFDKMPENVDNEIWVSRITAFGIIIPTSQSFLEHNGYGVTLPKDYYQSSLEEKDYEVTLTKKYFQKNHEFRTGIRLYDEKSWNYIPERFRSFSESIPLSNYISLNKKTDFFIDDLSKSDFIALLNEESNELGLWIMHGLSDLLLLNNANETISSDELKSIDIKSSFLLPTSCLIGRYTEKDYLAGILLFSEKSEVVALIAATSQTLAWPKNYFAYSFQEGENIGNSYLDYLKFMDNYDLNTKLYAKDEENYRVILGDGTLKRQRYTIESEEVDYRKKTRAAENLKSLISPASIMPEINTLRFNFLTSQIFWDEYVSDYNNGHLTYRLWKEQEEDDLKLIYEGKQTMAIDPDLHQDDTYYLQYVWNDPNVARDANPIVSKKSKVKASSSDLGIEYAKMHNDRDLENYILARRIPEEFGMTSKRINKNKRGASL